MSIATVYKILYLERNVNKANKINDCRVGNTIYTIGGGRQVCGHNELHRRRPSCNMKGPAYWGICPARFPQLASPPKNHRDLCKL